MREHIEILMVGLAAAMKRNQRRPGRRRGPRRARGTFVPVTPSLALPAVRAAH